MIHDCSKETFPSLLSFFGDQDLVDSYLVALPVYNEKDHVNAVLNCVKKFGNHIAVVDDGSTDGTSDVLSGRKDIEVLTHHQNQGYGGALKTAFGFAIENNYRWLVTIDCDGQHQPQLIRDFIKLADETGVDIVSGSRYLKEFEQNTDAPQQRRWVNQQVSKDLNRMFDFGITDAFCGFKAYRIDALKKLEIQELGYGMPLELWVQAACHKMTVTEIAVPLVYTDEKRSFGDQLDDTATRLNYYQSVIEKSIQNAKQQFGWDFCPCL